MKSISLLSGYIFLILATLTGIMGRILNLENKFVKLSSVPQTTLGLIITVFLKFVSAFNSP